MDALDEVYTSERKKDVVWMPSFLPKEAQTPANAFANHTPMAAEAMASLGVDDGTIAAWIASEGCHKGTPVDYETAQPVADWKESLGDPTAVAAYVAAIDADIARLGWREALKLWCSRLLPGLASRLFHGMLRVAHAVRALSNVDNSVRRRELSLALAAWATCWNSSMVSNGLPDTSNLLSTDVEESLLAYATRAAYAYVEVEGAIMDGIDKLHGVTAPMAYLDMLMPELDHSHHHQALGRFSMPSTRFLETTSLVRQLHLQVFLTCQRSCQGRLSLLEEESSFSMYLSVVKRPYELTTVPEIPCLLIAP